MAFALVTSLDAQKRMRVAGTVVVPYEFQLQERTVAKIVGDAIATARSSGF